MRTFSQYAPCVILAFVLITKIAGLTKAVKRAFTQLSFADEGSYRVPKADIAQAPCIFILIVGDRCFLVPFAATLDTLDLNKTHG